MGRDRTARGARSPGPVRSGVRPGMRRSAREHGPAEPAAQRRRRPRYGLCWARRAGGGGSAEGAGAGAPPAGAAAPSGGGAGPALRSEPPRWERAGIRGSRGSPDPAKSPAHPAAMRPPQARADGEHPSAVDAAGPEGGPRQ